MRPTAPTYIEMVMSWTEKQIKDELVFPTKYGKKSRWEMRKFGS